MIRASFDSSFKLVDPLAHLVDYSIDSTSARSDTSEGR